MFRSNNCLHIEAYNNDDWPWSIMDKRSTSGYYFVVGGNIVTWRGKK